jgi:hypothetical protein
MLSEMLITMNDVDLWHEYFTNLHYCNLGKPFSASKPFIIYAEETRMFEFKPSRQMFILLLLTSRL